MEKISLEELKHTQICILEDVARFCESHGICYFLAYGTLIGAIRHKGFIPWDDDIDLIMPRPDYEKFISSYSSKFYRTISPLVGGGYPFPYAKVEDIRTLLDEHQDNRYPMGINVDVFAIDGLPEDEKISAAHCRKIQYMRKLLQIKQIKLSRKRTLLKNIPHFIGKMLLSAIPVRVFVNKICKEATRYSFADCDYVADLNFGGPERRVPKSVFEESVIVEFEGKNYHAPVGYDVWLRKIFGDYMVLPPKENQMTGHTFTAYRK